MRYLIYKTTNLVNGKYYIGCHQTENIDDGYLGSGKWLKRAVTKYGKENFSFEILHEALSREEMFSLERELVNKELVESPLTYNLKIGGSGGNPGIVGAFFGRKHTDETKEKQRQASLRQVTTAEKRLKASKNSWARRDPAAQREHVRLINQGKPKTAEHNKKVSEANLGKIAINDGLVTKRIDKADLHKYEEQGWIKGGLPRKRNGSIR